MFHFGTGSHHTVGLHQAKSGKGNAVLGITASQTELEAYIDLVRQQPQIARNYLVYFGDIYLTNPALLPDRLDIVALFHLYEYFKENTTSVEYGGLTDLQVAEIFCDKTKPGGHILFFTGSSHFKRTEGLISELERSRPLERLGTYKSLLVYRKTI